jgi:hypothetical protein
MFPCPSSMADVAAPAMLAKHQRGPVGTLIVRPPGAMRMGPALRQWFTLCLVASAGAAYLTGLARAPGAADVFRVAAAAATPAYTFASVSDSIWKGVRGRRRRSSSSTASSAPWSPARRSHGCGRRREAGPGDHMIASQPVNWRPTISAWMSCVPS